MTDIIINSVTNINTNDIVITFILQVVVITCSTFSICSMLRINLLSKVRDILK